MESKKDVEFLLKSIKERTGLTQTEIAKRIKYSREYLSQAKKSNSESLYDLLAEEFKYELVSDIKIKGYPSMNPERAILLALLQDYTEWKSAVTGKDFQEVKAELMKKGHDILENLDSWLPK